MTDEPAPAPGPSPDLDPLESLKAADRRRGGCGAFLVGSIVMALIFCSLMAASMVLEFKNPKQTQLSVYMTWGAIASSIAGGIKAASLFTRYRVRRMDEKAARKAEKADPPST